MEPVEIGAKEAADGLLQSMISIGLLEMLIENVFSYCFVCQNVNTSFLRV